MQLSSTVFTLGAGSSVEFGLPTGEGLASNICKLVDFQFEHHQFTKGDHIIWRQLESAKLAKNSQIYEAGQEIVRGLPLSRSIDDFLYNHGSKKEIILLGKIAIVRSILEAEKKSNLSNLSSHSVQKNTGIIHSLSGTWAYRLFKFLQTDIRIEEIQNLFEGIYFINFNYDRCVEQFLYYAIQTAYSVTPEQAAAVMSRLQIIHPYGCVGKLPWAAPNGIEFGAEPERTDIVSLSTEISTFTEQRRDNKEVEKIKQIINGAKRFVFLGFAFHKQNMSLMNVQSERKNTPAFATVFGTSDADQNVFISRIEHNLRGGAGGANIFKDATCAEFIKEFGLQLASER